MAIWICCPGSGICRRHQKLGLMATIISVIVSSMLRVNKVSE
jgi:hypothetical protein